MDFLNVNQRFHGIGQGLFYSGSLSFGSDSRQRDSSSFHFVYDCGSESKKSYLEKEVTEYKRLRLNDDQIDLLIISHLHRDHINGLELLLKEKDIKVRSVILPYLEPAERLILMISDERRPTWYSNFLRNPTRYLLDKGVKQIFYLTGRGREGDIVPDDPPGDSPIERNEEMLFPDFHSMERDRESEERARMEDDILSPEVAFLKDTSPLALRGLWQFSFYVAPVKLSNLEKFKKCVEDFFLKREPNKRDFIEILKKKRLTRELKGCYEVISKNMNATSLGCLHGPIFRIQFSIELNKYGFPVPFEMIMSGYDFKRCLDDIYECLFYEYCDRCKRNLESLRSKEYTILLGDMNTKKEWIGLRRRYENYLSRIRFLQIPHHGSRYNWDSSIVNDIDPQRYVITAALKNRHNHPHGEVIRNISQSVDYEAVEWVNEYHSFNSEKNIFL